MLKTLTEVTYFYINIEEYKNKMAKIQYTVLFILKPALKIFET